MVDVVWTEPAIDQLDAIAEYIALDNPEAAARLVRRVVEGVTRLESFPESGRCPPEFPESVYREVVLSPCRIFYRVEDRHVLILHVMRQERDIRAYLLAQRGST